MAVLSSANRWWQNWSRTHAYVAQKAFFPRSVDEISEAILAAETDHRPVRAVGGGWSFSDASLPGTVTTNRPNAHAVDAIAGAAARAASFPTNPAQPVVGSIVSAPLPDVGAALVMFDDSANPPAVDPAWTYLGSGMWTWRVPPFGNPESLGGPLQPSFLEFVGVRLRRPIRAPGTRPVEETDLPGSLVMRDLAANPIQPMRDWFYNGSGIWSVGVAGDDLPTAMGTLEQLATEDRLIPPGAVLSPMASNPGDTLMVLLAKARNSTARPEPAYLIDTRSLVSSLQGRLPDLLTESAAEAMRADHGHSPRYFFHVETGVTGAELSTLLAHHTPRLTMQAITGSSGATLGGALMTATHGAEFNWPLLVDRVLAVHLVGPGGLQWWIEGAESIADPAKLMEAYPGLSPERIITGTAPRSGIPPQDWLKAVVVSMGCIGVMYSVVLEVVPLFGVREVVVQRTWKTLGFLGNGFPTATLPALLSDPATAPIVSRRIVKLMQSGNLNGTGIVQNDGQRDINQYADLAINPNARKDGDFDTWIGNREVTAALPIDPKPGPTNELGDLVDGMRAALNAGDLSPSWPAVYGLGTGGFDTMMTALGQVIGRGGTTSAKAALSRLEHASDLVDVGLDIALTPMGSGPLGFDLAQHVLTGVLAGLLGTANSDKRSDRTGVTVGAAGFPSGGVMGAALEIALAPADAFGFIQTQILNVITPVKPFLGYVSVRLVRPTDTLLGMEQFEDPANPCSVMIEVVAFGNDDGRAFIADLQQRTVNLINSGLEAMLHWGLENDRFSRVHLHRLVALQRPAASGLNRLDTFKAVRALIRAEAATTERVFDNTFTTRLGLDADVADQPYDFGRFTLNGLPRTIHFHFPNNGPGPVAMVPPTVDGDFGPHNLAIVPVDSTANPGDEISVDVTFTPSVAGRQTGTLTILSAVPGVPNGVKVDRIRLRALVEVLALVVLDPLPPAVLDLGEVPIGDVRTAGIRIRSDSTGNATLESFSLSDPEASTQIGLAIGPIAVGQTRTYQLTYQPDTVGPMASDLILHFTDGLAPPQLARDVVVPIAGIGRGAQAQLSPAALEFAPVVVGESSPPQQVLLTNVGQEPLIVSGLLLGGDFRLDGTLPTTIAPGGAEALAIAFEPVGDGDRTSDLSVISNGAQPPTPTALRGQGIVQVVLHTTPASLECGDTPVGSRSGERSTTIRNDGVIPAAIQAVRLAGTDAVSFGIVRMSRAVPVTLLPEMALDIWVDFGPDHQGAIHASLEVDHDGPTSPLQVRLAGQGIAATGLVADTTELDFGALDIATTSTTSKVTFTNVEVTPAQVTAISIVGPDAGDFALTRRVVPPIDVDAGETISLGLRATPSDRGARAAALQLGASVPASQVDLRALGLALSVAWSASMLDFGTCQVGGTSQQQTATVQNTGNRPLLVAAVDTLGDFIVRDLSAPSMSIPPGQWKYLRVSFRPTAAGPQQGAVQVHTDAGDVLSLPLIGIGV